MGTPDVVRWPRGAGLWPQARYAEILGAYVLSPLDEPEAVAGEPGQFLTSTRVRD
jgi:hypothetical protein